MCFKPLQKVGHWGGTIYIYIYVCRNACVYTHSHIRALRVPYGRAAHNSEPQALFVPHSTSQFRSNFLRVGFVTFAEKHRAAPIPSISVSCLGIACEALGAQSLWILFQRGRRGGGS